MNFTPIKQAVEAAKGQFEGYINDKSFPLEERWLVWLTAPQYLKNHKRCMYYAAGIDDDFVGYEMKYHAERHQTVDVTELARVVTKLSEDKDPAVEDLTAFKEDILSRNMGSFVYDW